MSCFDDLLSVLLEDASSTKAQVLNSFVRNEVGQAIFKYKNKPENKEAIDKVKEKFTPIVDTLADIVVRNNPKDKNLMDVVELAKFIKDAYMRLIEREYKAYVAFPSLVAKGALKQNFRGWTEMIHREQAQAKGEEYTAKLGGNEDPNKVYEDENVIVFLANDVNDPAQSVRNCILYGKGSNLCIS